MGHSTAAVPANKNAAQSPSSTYHKLWTPRPGHAGQDDWQTTPGVQSTCCRYCRSWEEPRQHSTHTSCHSRATRRRRCSDVDHPQRGDTAVQRCRQPVHQNSRGVSPEHTQHACTVLLHRAKQRQQEATRNRARGISQEPLQHLGEILRILRSASTERR